MTKGIDMKAKIIAKLSASTRSFFLLITLSSSLLSFASLTTTESDKASSQKKLSDESTQLHEVFREENTAVIELLLEAEAQPEQQKERSKKPGGTEKGISGPLK